MHSCVSAGAQRLDLQELELQAVLLLGAGNRTWDAEKQEAAEPSLKAQTLNIFINTIIKFFCFYTYNIYA